PQLDMTPCVGRPTERGGRFDSAPPGDRDVLEDLPQLVVFPERMRDAVGNVQVKALRRDDGRDTGRERIQRAQGSFVEAGVRVVVEMGNPLADGGVIAGPVVGAVVQIDRCPGVLQLANQVVLASAEDLEMEIAKVDLMRESQQQRLPLAAVWRKVARDPD